MTPIKSLLGLSFVVCALVTTGCANNTVSGHASPALALARNRLFIAESNFVIVVDRDPSTKAERINVNGSVVDRSAIYDTLKRSFDASQTDAIIEAAPDVSYGTVSLVIDAAGAAGFRACGLANRTNGPTGAVHGIAGFQKFLRNFDSPARRQATNRILVSVSRANAVWIGRKQTRPGTLYADLANAVSVSRKHAAAGFTPHISLIADADANWQTIISVLDAARQAGDDDVGFVTQ